MTQARKRVPRLTVLLKGLAPGERQQLITRLGISRVTYYRWMRKPGTISWDALKTMQAFLDSTYGGDHDMASLAKLVPVATTTKQAA